MAPPLQKYAIAVVSWTTIAIDPWSPITSPT
jgi:hypothetical protein